MFSEIKGQWRVVLVTLLAANLVFMALLQLQRLEISRIFQKPSTERFDFLAQELAEAKKTEITYLDLIYVKLDELNIRIKKIENATSAKPQPNEFQSVDRARRRHAHDVTRFASAWTAAGKRRQRRLPATIRK